MAIPEDFQFTDNDKVNTFVVGRAELIFGKDWKSQKDIAVSYAHGWTSVEDEQLGWRLDVSTQGSSIRHNVYCRKNGKLEDPGSNIAARSQLYLDGKVSFQSHHSADKLINPPDGTPARANYRGDGVLDLCWYALPNGRPTSKAATTGEITKRVAAAKHTVLVKLCDTHEDVIALKPSASSSKAVANKQVAIHRGAVRT